MVNAVRLIDRFVLHAHDPARILLRRGAASVARVGRVKTMYRVIAIIGGALALAACSSSSDWLNLDALKPAPAMDTVRFESDPPGAEAKTSNGQTCTTPCALALPAAGPLTVTFTLAGYQPETQSLDVVSNTGSTPTLQPNPVSAELTAAMVEGIRRWDATMRSAPLPRLFVYPTGTADHILPTGFVLDKQHSLCVVSVPVTRCASRYPERRSTHTSGIPSGATASASSNIRINSGSLCASITPCTDVKQT